ncbi:trypsin-like serine protease [Myxococcota bacterium]|nr:trypsin-like serine protease [Myxococcota bacterium]
MLFLAFLAPTEAVVIDAGDGTGNTSAPADDPGWRHVGIQGGLPIIYLGNDWVLTAGHVPFSNVWIDGVSYTSIPGSRILLPNPTGGSADLAVWQIEDGPDFPNLPIRENDLEPAASFVAGDEVVMIGRGRSRGVDPITCGSFTGYDSITPNVIRWGTNQVLWSGIELSLGAYTTDTFVTQFDAAPVGTDTRCESGDCSEAQATMGDSGGAVFAHDGTRWELAGVMLAVASQACSLPAHPSTVLYGDQTYIANLSSYRDAIIAIVRSECSNGIDDDGDGMIDLLDPGCLSDADEGESPDCDGTDSDSDGIGDVCDNCILVSNADQIDSDGDLYGNFCDADYDGDGVTGAQDFMLFRASYGREIGDEHYDLVVDADSNGNVGTSDFIVFRSMFGRPPGPSGLVP